MFCAHIPKLDSSASCFIQSRTLARCGPKKAIMAVVASTSPPSTTCFRPAIQTEALRNNPEPVVLDPSCSQSRPAGGLGAETGRHGHTKPAARIVRSGRDNMEANKIGSLVALPQMPRRLHDK